MQCMLACSIKELLHSCVIRRMSLGGWQQTESAPSVVQKSRVGAASAGALLRTPNAMHASVAVDSAEHLHSRLVYLSLP